MTSPPTKILGDVSPAAPAGLTPVHALQSHRRNHACKVGADLACTVAVAVDANPWLPFPPPSLPRLPLLLPPTFHPIPDPLFFPSPLKFSKEVWGSTVCFPRRPAKNGSQSQKLEGTKYIWSTRSLKLEGTRPTDPIGGCACGQSKF